jgi:hypothetical protein
MADGGVSFSVSLLNNVSGPARKAQRSMDDLKKSVVSTKSALSAPSPKRSGVSDWQKMTAKANRSQVADFAREQARMVKLTAVEHAKATKLRASKEIKEAKRIADFKTGLAQTKLDNKNSIVDALGGAALGGTAAVGAAALAAAASVAYLTYQFGKASIAAAAFSESSIKSIGMLTKNAAGAGAQFDDVRKQAQTLGLDVQGTVGAVSEVTRSSVQHRPIQRSDRARR